MKKLSSFIICVMICLPFSLNSFAVLLSSDEVLSGDGEQGGAEVESSDFAYWLDRDGDSYKQVFLAEGNIFIEYDYFLDRVDRGLDFKADGKVSFFPDLDPEELPLFSGFNDELGISFSDGSPADYFFGADALIDVDIFASYKNIYIVGNGTSTPVPLPASIWLFVSGLSLFALRRRASVTN